MKAQELRLGNIISKNQIGKVTKIDGNFIDTNKEHDIIDCFNPIELTKEWLNRCEGLKRQGDRLMYIFNWTRLNIAFDSQINKWRIGVKESNNILYTTITAIKYIHEFQNLYSLLTNEGELKINENNKTLV